VYDDGDDGQAQNGRKQSQETGEKRHDWEIDGSITN